MNSPHTLRLDLVHAIGKLAIIQQRIQLSLIERLVVRIGEVRGRRGHVVVALSLDNHARVGRAGVVDGARDGRQGRDEHLDIGLGLFVLIRRRGRPAANGH